MYILLLLNDYYLCCMLMNLCSKISEMDEEITFAVQNTESNYTSNLHGSSNHVEQQQYQEKRRQRMMLGQTIKNTTNNDGCDNTNEILNLSQSFSTSSSNTTNVAVATTSSKSSSTSSSRFTSNKIIFENDSVVVDESQPSVVSLRASFKKSNTCGSLFAKCTCGHHYYTNCYYNPYNTIATDSPLSSIPPSVLVNEENDIQYKSLSDKNIYTNKNLQRQKSIHSTTTNHSGFRRLFQSYSHPDATGLIFTDENKVPKHSAPSRLDNITSNKKKSTSTNSFIKDRDRYICTKTGEY